MLNLQLIKEMSKLQLLYLTEYEHLVTRNLFVSLIEQKKL